MERQILREIIIPDYPDKVLVSQARRAVYYVSKTSTKRGNTKIPKSYIPGPDSKYEFNTEGILIKKATREPIISNPRTAGNPRYWVVNFQQIWNGLIARQARANLTDKLKKVLLPYIEPVKSLHDSELPVKLEFFIFDTELNADVSNKGVVYVKVIEDLLVGTGVIRDDSKEFINDTGRIKFIQVSNASDKKMIVRISKSDNEAI